MLELNSATITDYLRAAGRIGADEEVQLAEMAEGVSNSVLRVVPAVAPPFMVKQACEESRAPIPWTCSRERIFRELETLRYCQLALAAYEASDDVYALAVPEVLWHDRDVYAFAMTAAPAEAASWKTLLLNHELDPMLADAAGTLLGQLHAWGWQRGEVERDLSDTRFFEALRIAPYYRHVLRVHPELSASMERLIETLPRHRLSLVHGDFSPRNILVAQQTLLLIDHETGHFGDPAFDAGFMLAHLVLKTIWSSELRGDYAPLIQYFWDGYRRRLQPRIGAQDWIALEERAIFHLAGCLLARVDGQHPVEYLSRAQQEQTRELGRVLLTTPPETVAEVKRRVE
jgi:5-methylthioribose kinase